MYIYKSRKKSSADISMLINEVREIETVEKNIATQWYKETGNLQ